MANLLDTIRIGGNSLSAQQIAAQVIGNNISGASVEGYHRQDANFISQSGLGGIRDVNVQRAASRFLDVQINDQVGEYAFENERAQSLSVVMSAVGTLEEGGLSEGFSNFFGSLRNINVTPADVTTRRDLLAQSDVLCTRFNQASSNLEAAQRLADTDLMLNLGTVNDALDQVAQLNADVLSAQSSGQPSSALADERDRAVSHLASLIGATTSVDHAGMYTVSLGGISVVSSTAAYHLVGVTDPGSPQGLHEVQVQGTTQGNIASRITSGLVGGKLAARDIDIPNALAQLDQLAFDFGTAVNDQHSVGYGLDGSTGNKLFDLPSTPANTSRSIAVATPMLNAPSLIAAASDPSSVYGDASNALAMIGIESSNVCNSNSETPAAAAARVVSNSGEAVALSQARRDTAEVHLLQIKALAEQQTGVSLNEQLLQLSRIENAFQASAKLVQVAERMLDALQAMV